MFSISDSLISPLVHFITNYFCPLSATVSQPSGSTVEEEHEQDDDIDDETDSDSDGESSSEESEDGGGE